MTESPVILENFMMENQKNNKNFKTLNTGGGGKAYGQGVSQCLKNLEVKGLVSACAWNCDYRKLQQSSCNTF